MNATHDRARFAELARQYRDALLDDVIPFWQRHSIDGECGGYFSCLDRTGKVFSTDKFVWMQARQVWMFSALVNRLERRDDWLDVARHGAAFLRAHGTDAAGNWYLSLDRAGQPLAEPHNLLSDCFAAMAFGQFALATGDEAARDLALTTYHNILRRQDNPEGQHSKATPGARPPRSLALPMILASVTLELDWMLDAATVDDTLDACLRQVMGDHLDRERLLLHESAMPDGPHADCDGRLITSGLGVEAMWIIMDIARRRGDRALIDTCVDVVLSTAAFGWDDEYGGLFSSLDDASKPPQQPGGDHKVWWVHLEALVALAMGHELTGRDDCWQWFRRVHDYAWARFPDPTYGEWYGNLNRRGEVLLSHKGGKWKGCFHVPRALWLCWLALERLAQSQPGEA